MKPITVKADFYISPKTYAEYYFKTNSEELGRARLVTRSILEVGFSEQFKYLELQAKINKENSVILFDKDKEPECPKNFINLCSLPLDFFETLQKELPMTSQSYAFNTAAHDIQKKFILLMLKNITQQVLTRVLSIGKVKGSNYFHAEPLTFADFKQTKIFKKANVENITKCFIKEFKKVFGKEFWIEIDIKQDVKIVKVSNFSNNAHFELELLSYTLADFEFLNDFHADLQKAFLTDYFIFILHNNMQQILKGVKNENQQIEQHR